MPTDPRIAPRKPTDYDKAISDQLRVVRRRSGITLDELATKLGISYQQVNKYEKGTNRISAGRLQQVAEILEQPIASFYPDVPVPADETPQQVADRIIRETAEGLGALRTAIKDLGYAAERATIK